MSCFYQLKISWSLLQQNSSSVCLNTILLKVYGLIFTAKCMSRIYNFYICLNESNFLVCLTVKKGDRVAQLVCEKICYPELVEEKVKKKNNNHLNCPKNLI